MTLFATRPGSQAVAVRMFGGRDLTKFPPTQLPVGDMCAVVGLLDDISSNDGIKGG